MVRTLMVVLSLLLATDFAAFAQYNPRSYQGTPEEQEACRPDAARLCRGLGDPGDVRACLVSHRPQLKAGCRRVLQRHGY
jgi:hypothetical protein